MAQRFQERGRATGYMDEDAFLAWAEQAEEGIEAEADILRRVFTRYGLLLAALLVIPLGLLLNLTPCVLPMIPPAIIGRVKASEKGTVSDGAASMVWAWLSPMAVWDSWSC